MWLHRFDIISLSIVCLGAIICDVNIIAFVSVYARRACDDLSRYNYSYWLYTITCSDVG